MGWVAIAVIIVVEAVCWAVAFGRKVSQTAFWLLCCAPTIFFGLASLAYGWRFGLLDAWFAAPLGDVVLGLLVTCGQYVMALLAARYLLPAIHHTDWLEQLYARLNQPGQAINPWIALAGLMLTCGCEEIVWRGFATHVALDHGFDRWWAWGIASLANGVLYIPLGIVGRNWIIPGAATLGGFVTGLLSLYLGGRLWGPILGHGPFDFLVVILLPLWPLPA